MGKVAIAILAAGRGSRLQSPLPKPLTLFKGRPLISHALGAAQESGLDPVVTVVGYRARQVIASLPTGAHVVFNPSWQTGIASSVRCALTTFAADLQVDAVCIGLADQPLISAIAYQRLTAAYRKGAMLAVATYDCQRQNPVLVARPLWSAGQKISGDRGMKQIMQQHSVCEVSCEDIASAIDIDTTADLLQLQRFTD
ncbi:nucleotidyltransferase family protein [cf. Phormidesmis sp. LEGE 11477]|nr:nucleotidyltransferase family protein [cf. Phormidesmis sp. LEGE 11477]